MTTQADVMPEMTPQIAAHISPNPSPSQVLHDITNEMLPTTIDSDLESNNTPKCDQLLLATQSPFPSRSVLSQLPAPVAPARAKRPRTLAYPCPDDETRSKRTKISTPMGTSKQAASKRRALDQIQDGTFVRNPKRWEVFKSKLAQLDPHFEVSETDPTLSRSVKHSRCGSWVLMAVPYDVERFKKHIKSCSYSTEAGGMKTLNNYGIIVQPMKALTSPTPSLSVPSTSGPSVAHVPLPCLGLTEKDNPRIAQYIKRTSVNSAGGKDIHDIAMDLFSVAFKTLSKEKKDIVRQKQVQTHIWSVDRMRKSVHAIGKDPCNGNARQGKDGTLEPCNSCLALLSLRAFRNAISREPPKNENRAYVPHTFQPAEVGKLYGMGLNTLIDGVRLIHTD